MIFNIADLVLGIFLNINFFNMDYGVMKIINSSIISNKNIVDFNSSRNDDEKEQVNISGKCAGINNSHSVLLSNNTAKEKNADIIKGFFRKSIAAQSYGKMFSTGNNFKKLGIDLPPASGKKFSFSTLRHLDEVSRAYLGEIKDKTQNLTPEEKRFLSKVMETKLHFRHQSNTRLVTSENILNIMSQDKLNTQGCITDKNTMFKDIEDLGNHDFVFLVSSSLMIN